MKNFKAGDKVKTKFGNGVIVGYEPSGYGDYGREVVKLDEGHTWAFKDSNACFYKADLELI